MDILLITAGLVVLTLACRNLWLARQSTKWPETRGTIDDTAVRETGSGNVTVHVGAGIGLSPPPMYWQDVLYRYEVDGRYYSGSRKYFGWRKRKSFASGRSVEYAAGAPVIVRYHPAKPSLAVIEPGVNLSIVVEVLIGVALAGFGVWLWVAG